MLFKNLKVGYIIRLQSTVHHAEKVVLGLN